MAPLTPRFVRVTFGGADLAVFGTDGLDQRIKIVFPLDGIGFGDFGADDESVQLDGSWYARWRDLPDGERNPFRTYTVRAVRTEDRELDADFFVHADGGPAARWLSTAAAGDEVIIVGPDARSIHSATGLDWRPGAAREVLLAGDETAAPAICAVLESLPAGMKVHAFIVVPTARDIQPIFTAADAAIRWLPRETGGQGLESAVRQWTAEHPAVLAPAIALARQQLEDIDVDERLLWESPAAGAGSFYAWLAGEAAEIKALRRLLVTEIGVDRSRVAFMGYWRLGKAEKQ